MERYVAIDNVCGWPNLTRLPNGDIIAAVFNQPCHGRWAGDVDCWASADEGATWQFRGRAAPHDPGTNRMNIAVGLAHNGDLIVLTSGWSNKPEPGHGETKGAEDGCDIIAPWVCRSSDGGRTWRHAEGIARADGYAFMIPYGDITRCPDGSLAAAAYARPAAGRHPMAAFFLRSRDDGHTWGEPVCISADHYGEPATLHLGSGRWFAALRSIRFRRLDLFVSEDDGKSWRLDRPITGDDQHPAHWLPLADGRILLTYGMRHIGFMGLGARFTNDGGKLWQRAMVLTEFEDAFDVGYPSCVELKDGRILTAYYANRIAAHTRYHVGMVRWSIDEQMKRNASLW